MAKSPVAILYDAAGNPVEVVNDGGVYRLRVDSKLTAGHGLALESKQDTLLTELQLKADLSETQPVSAASLPLPTGASTEATLALIKAKTDNLDVALSSRAVTGLTDAQLRATSVPVTAAQGTKGSAANAWPTVLYDAAGNAVTVTLEDGVRRLAVDVKQKDGQTINVTVGQDVPEDLRRYVSALALSGGSSNLIVNGSVTPVVFDYGADPTKDIALTELRIVAACQDIAFDGASFGGLAALANGLLVQIINEFGTQTVFNIKTNEDFLFFPSPVGILLNNTGPKDVFAAGFFVGGSRLRAGTSDKVRITVRDNITGGGAAEFKYLQARVFGVKAA